MAAPPQIMPLFAVPLGSGRHPDPVRLNQSLRAYVLEAEKRGKDGANPRPLTVRNPGVYESHFDLFRDPHPAVQELKRFCWDQMLAFIGHLSGYDLKTLERLQIYNDAWFHITRRGGFFGLHNHPNAAWSGVYCVDPGQHDLDKPTSGALTFVNPVTQASMHLDAGNARVRAPYNGELRSVNFEAGQLVLFPSYLLHDVKPFEGNGTRITIAFNAWFSLPGEIS